MATTRAFKSGNSQAIRIPAELAYEDMGAELTITRLGDVITIVPAGRSLKEAVRALREIPKPSAVEAREPIDVPDRDRD
jgi:antitoxin VapB